MSGFNKAKTVYYDKNGDMVKNTNAAGVRKSNLIKSEIEQGTVVRKKGMKLVDIE